MRWPFRQTDPNPQSRSQTGSFEEMYGNVHYNWVQRSQPMATDAPTYAFVTLALPGFSPIGPSVAVRQPNPVPLIQQPYYKAQHIGLRGMGTQAGSFVMQPLANPNAPNAGNPNAVS